MSIITKNTEQECRDTRFEAVLAAYDAQGFGDLTKQIRPALEFFFNEGFDAGNYYAGQLVGEAVNETLLQQFGENGLRKIQAIVAATPSP